MNIVTAWLKQQIKFECFPERSHTEEQQFSDILADAFKAEQEWMYFTSKCI